MVGKLEKDGDIVVVVKVTVEEETTVKREVELRSLKWARVAALTTIVVTNTVL